MVQSLAGRNRKKRVKRLDDRELIKHIHTVNDVLIDELVMMQRHLDEGNLDVVEDRLHRAMEHVVQLKAYQIEVLHRRKQDRKDARKYQKRLAKKIERGYTVPVQFFGTCDNCGLPKAICVCEQI